MGPLLQLINDHGFSVGMGTMWALSALLYALPAPTPASRVYGTIYRLIQFAGANMNHAGIVKVPPSEAAAILPPGTVVMPPPGEIK